MLGPALEAVAGWIVDPPVVDVAELFGAEDQGDEEDFDASARAGVGASWAGGGGGRGEIGSNSSGGGSGAFSLSGLFDALSIGALSAISAVGVSGAGGAAASAAATGVGIGGASVGAGAGGKHAGSLGHIGAESAPIDSCVGVVLHLFIDSAQVCILPIVICRHTHIYRCCVFVCAVYMEVCSISYLPVIHSSDHQVRFFD